MIGFAHTAGWLVTPRWRAVIAVHAALALLTALCVAPTQASAEQTATQREPKRMAGLSPWPIDPHDPVGSLPSAEERNKNIVGLGYLLQDLSATGDKAFAAKKYDMALKFYQALSKVMPERSIAHVRVCETYEALGDLEKALQSCRIGLATDGVRIDDYERTIGLALRAKKQLTPADAAELDSIIAHMQSEKVEPLRLHFLRCQVGAHLENEKRLQDCTTALLTVAPDDPKTVTYQWSLAVLRKDWDGARKLTERARQTKMPEPTIRTMEAATTTLFEKENHAQWRKRFLWIGGGGAIVIAIVLAALWVARRQRSLVTPSAQSPA